MAYALRTGLPPCQRRIKSTGRNLEELLSTHLEFLENPPNAAVVPRCKVWHLCPLGCLFRPRLWTQCHLVSLLGVEEPLEWAITDEGFKITPPADLPSEIAVTFKIERQHPFEGTRQD